MANWLSRLFNRAIDGQPTQFGGYIGFYPSQFLPSETYLSPDQALSLSAVWGCVQYVSQSIASAEIKVLDVQANGSRQDSSRDRVYKLLNLRPNEDVTAVSFKEGLVSQTAVFGDGFAEIQRDSVGRPWALWLLPSTQVTPIRSLVTGRMAYQYIPTGGGQFIIPASDMIHLRGPSLYSFLGESIVTRAARSIAIAKAQDEFALSYYVNSTVLGGILKRVGPMNAKDAEGLEAKFEAARRGAAKAHKNVVLPPGVEYQPIETDAQKSQVVEGRSHSVIDICRFFGVPPPLVGDLGRATWANLESLYIQAVRDCLGPWATRLQQEIEWKCFGDASSKWVEVDLKPLTRGDAKSRAEANQILRRNGVINANEWREDEGLDPVGPDGDLYIVESNMVELDEDNLSKPEPAPPPSPAVGDPAEADPVEPDDAPAEDPVLRQALRQMLLQNLQRLETRAGRDRAALEKKGAKREDVLSRLHEWIAKDCAPALDLIREAAKAHGRHVNGEADAALLAAVEAVVDGAPPATEADRLMAELLPEVSA